MGQYWTMKNVDTRQVVSTHKLGAGLKYLEQWFSGSLYTALMLLLTDVSSLGYGGGDFCLEDAPEELKKFIDPVIGSWAGNRIVFSGDYTEIEEHKETDANGNELFTDISSEVALAVWSMVACEIMNENENGKAVKEKLIAFLKDNVSNYKNWETELKPIFEAIECVMPEKTKRKAKDELCNESMSNDAKVCKK